MTPDEAREVAGRLTKAQAKRLLGVQALRREGKQWASAYGDLSAHTARRTTRALINLDLLDIPYMTSNVALTVRGARVAAILQSTRVGEGGEG